MATSGFAASRYIGTPPQYGFFNKQSLSPDSLALIFTLDYTVATATSLLVLKDGVILEPDVDYTIITSGTQINFAVAPASGAVLYLQYLGQQLILPTAASYVAGSINPIDVNPIYSKALTRSSQIAVSQTITPQFTYFVNTLTIPVTLTLPIAPVFSDKIVLVDLYNNFSVNNCIINRNGKNINFVAADKTLNIKGCRVTLEYINTTIGWKMTIDTDREPADSKLFFLAS